MKEVMGQLLATFGNSNMAYVVNMLNCSFRHTLHAGSTEEQEVMHDNQIYGRACTAHIWHDAFTPHPNILKHYPVMYNARQQ